MKRLSKSFKKNGIDYELIKRNEIIAFFALSIDDTLVGYEVARIYQNAERVIAGKLIYATEGISGNEQFGYDGSRAFFPSDKKRAKEYFTTLDKELKVREAEKAEI